MAVSNIGNVAKGVSVSSSTTAFVTGGSSGSVVWRTTTGGGSLGDWDAVNVQLDMCMDVAFANATTGMAVGVSLFGGARGATTVQGRVPRAVCAGHCGVQFEGRVGRGPPAVVVVEPALPCLLDVSFTV